MRTEYFITLDTHCRSADACVKTARGKLVRRERMACTIPALADFIRSVPRPRHVCFEEGPLAGWLYRGLRHEADRTVVCDPRRNAYVGKDGDKDDPIDAEKLNDLFRCGMIRPVHQNDCADRAGFKQLVAAYHAAVRGRVAQANRLIALGKRWGLLWNTDLLLQPDACKVLLEQVRSAGAAPCVPTIVEQLVQGVRQAAEAEQTLAASLTRIARSDALMTRLMELPGYGPIRSATLVAYLDTPWRFKSREALWKYCGVGLRRARSGDGPEYLKVEQQCNRTLRAVVIGAAQKVVERIATKPGPQKENDDEALNRISRKYRRWLEAGVSPRNARRNLARTLATAAWAMWKSGEPFHPKWIDKDPLS